MGDGRMVGADRGEPETSPVEAVRAYITRGLCHGAEKRAECSVCQRATIALRSLDDAMLDAGKEAATSVLSAMVAIADTLGDAVAVKQARAGVIDTRRSSETAPAAVDRTAGREPIPDPWPDSPDGKYAARRLDAFSAQLSQAGRVIAAARVLPRPATDPTGCWNRLAFAQHDYDRAAERVAAIDAEGTGTR